MEIAKSLVLFSLVLSGFGVNGMVNDDDDTKFDPSTVMKTIVSGDEIIDCVDIYKQPAFNHPLLKNHTLQLRPSSYPTGSKSKISVNSTGYTQVWHKNGGYCPKGTVAILRSSTADIPPKNIHDRNTFRNNNQESPTIFHPELATALLPGLNGLELYGANADVNVWSPRIQPKELSVAQIWVTNGGGDQLESIEAGWMVSAFKPQPTFFIYWTYDGYRASGCYNVQCSGFVQTSYKIALGTQLQPVSTYDSEQCMVNIKIHRDAKTGHWWLHFQGIEIGYWPSDLFKNLKTSAKLIEWGGKVINTNPEGFHTVSQMGSGHLPKEGYGKAAWFKHLEYADGNGFFNPAADVMSHADRPECYDVLLQKWFEHEDFGATLLYGGPGYSNACQK